ncbi:MAG: alpha/beta hydrolase, partial [Gordonia sp. (in: high G+C Gram-positive bacteria)]
SITGAQFVVGDDGTVSHPSPKRRADAEFLSSRLRAILVAAQTADAALADRLRSLTGEFDGSDGKVPNPAGPGYVRLEDALSRLFSLSPDQVTRYWESLNAAQRTRLSSEAPEFIGNLDGIDFADRITANHLSIRLALAEEEEAGRGTGDKAKLLRSLLEPAPDPMDPTRMVPRTFIGFRANSGRFIELVGELTPSANGVGVLVPGTGTSLQTSGDYRRRAASLASLSGSPVIVWADGTFPQHVIEKDLTPIVDNAVDPKPAHRMAQRLANFTATLDQQLATSNTPLKTTIIGHSYGGSVVGTAEQHGMRADRVVYASSSGTGVDDSPWRNTNPDVKRFSLTPPGDPIHYSQQFGAAVHGGDPDSAPGVTRLDSGYYSNGELVQGVDAHAGYLDDAGSDALGNIADVISGRTPNLYVPRGPDIDLNHDAPLARDWLLDLVLPGR